jgi:threonine dehydratase
MLAEQPDLDTLVVAIGGGGLIAGMATAAKALKPGIEIVGVQTARFPSMVNAVQGTQHPQGQSTIAEGIAVGQPGRSRRWSPAWWTICCWWTKATSSRPC